MKDCSPNNVDQTSTNKLSVIDLFAGIGAFSLGLERAGMQTVRSCEINEFCRAVLAKHWPDVPCHDDVTTMEFTKGEADVICGGFPCQDLSGAGRRAGLSGTRSGLYRELVRAIRVVRPRVALVENVADLLTGPAEQPGAWFHEVLGDLAEGGNCVEWDSVSAETIGAPHERERVWIVVHADDAGFGSEPVDAEMARPSQHDGGRDAADPSCEQVGPARQPRGHVGVEPSLAAEVANSDDGGPSLWNAGALRTRPAAQQSQRCAGASHVAPDPSSLGRRQGRSWRSPDSFARVRDEARRNVADPYGARLAFREGFLRDAWEKLTSAERDGFGNVWQSIWPDEPALQGMDDGDAYWMDRIAATGNQVVPQIPELIGRAILEAAA